VRLRERACGGEVISVRSRVTTHLRNTLGKPVPVLALAEGTAQTPDFLRLLSVFLALDTASLLCRPRKNSARTSAVLAHLLQPGRC